MNIIKILIPSIGTIVIITIIVLVIVLSKNKGKSSGSGPGSCPPTPPSPPPQPPTIGKCPPMCEINDDNSFNKVSWNSFPNYAPSPKPVEGTGFKINEFTPDKWPKDKTIVASTTNYAFGGGTSCACNGPKLSNELANLGYVGVATPDWLQQTFNTQQTGTAAGGEAPTMLLGTKYASNCSSGSGGCGKCFELTVIDGEKPPLYNIPIPNNPGQYNTQQSPAKLLNGKKQTTIKVVNLDTCEDRNAYGPNWQWCNAAKDINPTDTFNFSGNNPPKSWGSKLRYGRFYSNSDLKNTVWVPPSDCIDTDGNWICTNLAGAPIHFDFAIASFLKSDPQNLLNKINPDIDWTKWKNPIVHARPINCDNCVIDILKKYCGGNLNDPPDKSTCISYCAPFNKKPGDKNEIPFWWGGCDNKWDCAEIGAKCGGKNQDGTEWNGPTCCQWDQVCVKDNEWYSGCKDK